MRVSQNWVYVLGPVRRTIVSGGLYLGSPRKLPESGIRV